MMIKRIKQIFGAPGTAPWLLLHEFRLAWRTLGLKRPKLSISLWTLIWAAIHLAAAIALHEFQLTPGKTQLLNLNNNMVIGAVFWVFFSFVLAQTLAHAGSAFFTRGDLDLLLSSPIHPRTVLSVRALVIGLSACLLPIFFVLPLAHVGLFFDMPFLLTIYPAIAALGLLAGGLGVALSMLFVWCLGAKRARVAIQITAAFMGTFFALAMQAQSLLKPATLNAVHQWLVMHAQEGELFAPQSLLWWPGRAFQGEWLPMLGFLMLAILVFTAVVQLAYKRFVTGVLESGVEPTRRQVSRNHNGVRFDTNLNWIMFKKEWRMIGRDPQVISQTLLELLYLLPMIFMILTGKFPVVLFLPIFVIIAATLASNLAWLTIAAEDAPELIVTSPVSIMRTNIIKGAAAVIPVLLLTVPLVLYSLVTNPRQGLVLAFTLIGATVTAALLHILNPRPGDRREMKNRYKQNVLDSIFGLISSAGWGLLGYGMLSYVWLCLVALPLIMAGPLYAYFANQGSGRNVWLWR